MTIEAAGFDLAVEGNTFPIMGFERIRLEDGEATDAYIDMRELAAAHASPVGPVRYAWFRDAGGKVHKTPVRGKSLASWAKRP